MWYVRSGSAAGRLKLYLLVGKLRDTTLADLSGDAGVEGNFWQMINVTVSPPTSVVWQVRGKMPPNTDFFKGVNACVSDYARLRASVGAF